MIAAFEEIIKARDWSGSQGASIAKILNNIQNRLKKRLPEGVEPSLTKFQKKAIDSCNFWRDWNNSAYPDHLMVQGATSAGKTLLSELNILDTLRHSQKAIVLVPLKAMVHERTAQFREDMEYGLSESDVKKVYGSSGDYMEYDEMLIHGEHDVAIIVYEKFFAMLSQGNGEIMRDCGLLIVDELSMLSSEQRGSKLEMTIEIVRQKYPETRIMCLATCDCSTEKVCEWLNIKNPIISTARPVALEEHILELNGKGVYRIIPADYEHASGDDGPEMYEEKIVIPDYKPDWRTSEKERQLLLSVISRIYENTPDSRVLVFVATQSKAAAIAEFLKDSITKWFPQEKRNNINIDEDFIRALEACDRDEGQEKLIDEFIPYGIAYHHAGISTTLRELIEEQFSKLHSNLRVIVATETLTVGVNMPFDAMIMLSNLVPRGIGMMVPLNMQEYRNYIGRAGRLGQSNRIGKTYLFVEKAKDLAKYWDSYYNHDEVMSALTKVDTEGVAPYYLSLLNNSIKIAKDEDSTESSSTTTYTLAQLEALFEQSLSKICGKKTFESKRLYDCLYNAYLSDKKKSGARGRGETKEEYAIADFGKHMAPYALSMDTCIKIFWYFYEGYKHEGFPCDVTQQDIESDRYLLEILYHVCCHKEIEESSNLIYPIGDNNLSRSYSAKGKVLEQLQIILSEKDENGNPKNVLWCDVHNNSDKENNDIWMLLNKSNLIDESLKLQAAMRAIILFYWTKGFNIKKIREITKFGTFGTKINSGDIERIAEVTSFHLDAIYKCLKYARNPQTQKKVYQDESALKSFYALHTRVKYGMPRDLVVFANKHIHGLDRQRLLSLKNEADKSGLTPIQYLYITPPKKISEKILTMTQQVQLRQAIERRGSRSINTLMEIIENDLATNITSEQLNCIRMIAGWGDEEETGFFASQDIYQNIKDIRKNPALKSVEIYSDGSTCKIVWRINDTKLHIGVLNSTNTSSEICEFFKESEFPKILIVPHSFSDEQMKSALKEHRADALLDNVYFAFILAKAIRIPVDNGLALTEMLADLRGIFTKMDYDHFPLLRYISNNDTTIPKYRLIYGNSIAKRFENKLSESSLESALRATDDLQDFEILPWGRKLNPDVYDFTECPTIVLLNRSDITHSDSLTRFIYKMRNQNFDNCILLIESELAEQEWNSREQLEEFGHTCWCDQFNKISKKVVYDVQMAIQEIRSFITKWKPKSYFIGISYAHYDSKPSENISGHKNDVDLITRLANKLSYEYGEDCILFDQFDPAKNLFDENRGEDKALEAYKSCRFYLILWNVWTLENQNCKKERNIIIEHCRDDINKCMFLQTGHPNDPKPPKGYFSQMLSEDTLESLYERIKDMINDLLK